MLAPRADGLVREMKTKKVISREEIQERTETEDVKHFGDFTDEVSFNKGSFSLTIIVKLLILINLRRYLLCECGCFLLFLPHQLTIIVCWFLEFYVDDHR